MNLKVHLNVLGENNEIHKRFSAPVKREFIKADEDGKKALKVYPTK